MAFNAELRTAFQQFVSRLEAQSRELVSDLVCLQILADAAIECVDISVRRREAAHAHRRLHLGQLVCVTSAVTTLHEYLCKQGWH